MPASPGLRWAFAERSSVKHPELSELNKAKPYGGLCYGYFLGQEDSFDLTQTKMLEIAARPDTEDLAEGSRQSTLVDIGYAAQVCHVHERCYICSRDLLETVHNLSVSLGS